MEAEQKSNKRKYGRTGCIIGIILLIIIIIAIYTGLINFPEATQ